MHIQTSARGSCETNHHFNDVFLSFKDLLPMEDTQNAVLRHLIGYSIN